MFAEIRGNVETRLRKLDEGDFDAIVLAVAGLERLGLGERVTDPISARVCIPSAGQGAVGVECRSDDSETVALLRAINHQETETCVLAEREVTRMLEATCSVPIAVYAHLVADMISINAFVSDPDGATIIRKSASGDSGTFIDIAQGLGRELISDGAMSLISSGV